MDNMKERKETKERTNKKTNISNSIERYNPNTFPLKLFITEKNELAVFDAVEDIEAMDSNC